MSAQSRVTSRCDIAHCGREELHHFFPVLLRGMLPLFSIMTLKVQEFRTQLAVALSFLKSFYSLFFFVSTAEIKKDVA